MRECILLFQFDQTRQRKLVAQLMLAKFKVKVVSEEEKNLPIGYLAGNKDLFQEGSGYQEGMEGSRNEGQEEVTAAGRHQSLEGEMLVMAGITPNRLNTVLQAIRKSGIGPVPYKAVVTKTNQTWRAKELLEELKKEHEAMKAQSGEGRMLHEQT